MDDLPTQEPLRRHDSVVPQGPPLWKCAGSAPASSCGQVGSRRHRRDVCADGAGCLLVIAVIVARSSRTNPEFRCGAAVERDATTGGKGLPSAAMTSTTSARFALQLEPAIAANDRFALVGS